MIKKTRNTEASAKKRIVIISISFLLFASFLIINLFKLQILSYDYYKSKVYDQITTTSALRANRGNIYDSNMNLLATTNTSWRIFISTKDIKKAEKENKIKYSAIIAKGLSNILGISETALTAKIQSTNVLDVTIKKSATEKEYTEVLNFIKRNNLEKMVFTDNDRN